ncbi:MULTISPECIES: type II toxin-antitoxin system HicB family antitoxin [Rhodopseudomonas]|uniref:Transcriptional regulator n=1 Tax=Rhodopseudomonas palustris TaxID=1076 RepID=A0A0D7EQH4_RHOPL|nr:MULTISPECIES: type II toxin-antitoxin system HicB family antitoxin [Rhodopseudomonas]KIZ43079.1 transcriptional regulator [Rhodopseudomonas palustris]MDF3813530.1 type II toxin-antitoxin system HicB family antitoxin [Rhodopseudomonas sp. BAL398]WOK20713.1 type II toxin-antitoxin system HicB family antitoxin [Rhodopseudomonas sp. BAL398]
MRTYAYAAEFEPGDKRGVIVVSFPDVPEAITQGDSMADACAQAEEALGLALLTYPERGLPLPKARAKEDTKALVKGGAKAKRSMMVAVAPDVSAKLAVLEAFTAAGISKSELARRMGKDEKEIRRILNPKHSTKLPAMVEALRALGKRLVVGIEEAA